MSAMSSASSASPAPALTQPLDFLFHARSVALVGLSTDARKMTGAPLGILQRTGFAGPIWPINPRAEEIGGLKCYPDIASLPGTPDVALIMLAARHCAQAIRELAARGTRAAVVLSSGFEESEEGHADAAALRAAAAETGMAVVGPNCEGMWSVRSKVILTFGTAAKRDVLHHAPIAIVSQSGAMAGAVARHLQNDAVGCAYVISVGNETVLTIADYLEWLIEQDDVRVVLLFIEGLRDGAKLLGLIRKATARGIRVAVLKSGNSAAGVKAAASHTGKIASDYAVYRDLLGAAGAVAVDSLTDLITAGEVLSLAPVPHAKAAGQDGAAGVAVFSIPGGTRALTADQCEAHGVPLSTFARPTVAALTDALPEFGGVENPTDLTGQVLSHPGLFDRALSIIGADPNTEALIVQVANRGPADVMERTELLGKVASDTGVPVFATFLGDSMSAADRKTLRGAGVLCARDAAEAARHLGWLYRARAATNATNATNAAAAASLPEGKAVAAPASLPVPGDWAGSVAWLEACGIALPRWRLLRTGDDVAAACAGLTMPVAVKALPENADHKTELGLLALGLTDATGVAREAARIRAALAGTGVPDAPVLVQEMVKDGTEVLLAAVRNPDFGPVLAIGLGGIAVELFREVAWLALPTTPAAVKAAVARLKLGTLLAGFRGKPAGDLDALARAAVGFGDRFVATAASEIEINPLFVRPVGRGVCAVDVLFKG